MTKQPGAANRESRMGTRPQLRAGSLAAIAACLIGAEPDMCHAQTKPAGTTEVVVRGMERKKPQGAPPSLDLYGALPHIRQIALSPSGNEVVVLTRQEGMNLLVVTDLRDSKKRYVKLADGLVSALSWSDENHVVVSISWRGLRGTCTGGQGAPSVDASLISSARGVSGPATMAQEPGRSSSSAPSQVSQGPSQAMLDAIQPPGCVYYGVHEENMLTSVDIRTSTGTALGGRMGDAPNMPLGLPRRVTLNGTPQLIGPFIELRPRGVGNQPADRVYLWQIDPETGRGRLIDDEGGDIDRENRYVDDYLVDSTGQIRARSVYEYRSETYRVEFKTGKTWKAVLSRNIVANDHTFGPYLIGLAADDGAVVVLDTEMHGNTTHGVARRFHYYKLAGDGSMGGPLDVGDASQDRPIFNAGTGLLEGFSSSAEETSYRFFDPGLTALYGKARDATPGTADVVSVADDPHRMVIHTQGREDTGSYYLLDFTKGSSVSLGEDYPDVPTEWIASQELVTYHAVDGTAISAIVTFPPKPDLKDLPVIVLPHDGPLAHDAIGFDWLAQALASRGYLVMQPNYRGSDGHGVDFMRAGFGQWNGKMLSDIADGVQYLVSQRLADARRICYVGIGYGGYAALKAATQGNVRCAASIGGISDVAAFLSWKKGTAPVPDPGAYADLAPDPHSPHGFAPDPQAFSSLLNYVGDSSNERVTGRSVQAPVLLIHAAADAAVPVSQSERLRDELHSSGKSVDWLKLDGADHGLDGPDSRRVVLESLTDFLAKNNPAN